LLFTDWRNVDSTISIQTIWTVTSLEPTCQLINLLQTEVEGYPKCQVLFLTLHRKLRWVHVYSKWVYVKSCNKIP
jgi:hypothetical protein